MFEAIVNRTRKTQKSESWQKIPWHDPDFSRRMLKEHLSQAYDAASRRTAIIDQQVTWIHQQVLQGNVSNILDLGCGPGLYAARLAAMGHVCTGIDFSPASIEYARENGAGSYMLGDVRQVEFGTDYDLVMMIFGELNAFSKEEAQRIVSKAYSALKPGGKLLLEAHPYAAVERTGQEPPTWYSAQSGLFSDQPYLCLEESFFEDDCAVWRGYVIDAKTGQTTEYVNMLQAYTEDDYRHLLRQFDTVTFYPTLANEADEGNLCAIVASKS
jgi:SAM-dependent methyltransferase